MKSSKGLYLWSDCVLTATYINNKTPSSVLKGKTPFQLVYGSEPSLSHLRVFDCLCFATKLNVSDKFESRAEKSIMIGYSNSKKGYKFFSLESKQIFFSRDVKFYENIFPSTMKINESNSKQSSLNQLIFFDMYDTPILEENASPNDDEEGLGKNDLVGGELCQDLCYVLELTF